MIFCSVFVFWCWYCIVVCCRVFVLWFGAVFCDMLQCVCVLVWCSGLWKDVVCACFFTGVWLHGVVYCVLVWCGGCFFFFSAV